MNPIAALLLGLSIGLLVGSILVLALNRMWHRAAVKNNLEWHDFCQKQNEDWRDFTLNLIAPASTNTGSES